MQTSLWAVPLGLILMIGTSTADTTPMDFVTTDSSIFSGGVSNNYDSLTGLSQHIGTCFLKPVGSGPCASIASKPATNVLGLTSASVSITHGDSYDPQNGVSGFGAASSSANLATGILGTFVSAPQCSPATPLCSDEGTAMAAMRDSITFTNNSGITAHVLVTWSFDGTVIPTAIAPGAALYTITSDFCLAPGTTCAFGDNPNEFQFQDSTGTITNTLPTSGWASSHLIHGSNPTSETFRGTFAVPTGMSTDYFVASLFLGCTMADCDFSHTGALNIGSLPAGVTYTSGSGVLLTASSVPEPASGWLVLTAGILLFDKRVRSRFSRGSSREKRLNSPRSAPRPSHSRCR